MSAPTPASGQMNLFLQCSSTSDDSQIDLYLQGGTSGTQSDFNSIPLYLNSDPYSSYLNLSLGGYDAGSLDGELNLYLEARTTTYHNSVSLVLLGTHDETLNLYNLTLDELMNLDLFELDYLALGLYPFAGWNFSNSIPLYIRGSGITDGSIPTSSNLNLYLSGPPGSIGTLLLYTQGSLTASGQIPLYLDGVSGYLSQTTNLYLYGVGTQLTGLPLFSRGWTG